MNWGSYTPIPQEVEQAATICVDCGMTVHRILGPGFKEPIYEEAFRLELHSRGVAFEAEKAIAVRYKSWEIPGQRVDLLVAGVLLVEIKAVPTLLRIHQSQVLSYLKTMDLRLGLLMNFGGRLFKEGLKRVVR
jgi:GxxExxY protein